MAQARGKGIRNELFRRAIRTAGSALLLTMMGCSDDSAEKPPPDEAGSPAAAGNAPFTFKVQSDREREELAQREKEFDPSNDGWESEAFHGETSSQLLGALCTIPTVRDRAGKSAREALIRMA